MGQFSVITALSPSADSEYVVSRLLPQCAVLSDCCASAAITINDVFAQQEHFDAEGIGNGKYPAS